MRVHKYRAKDAEGKWVYGSLIAGEYERSDDKKFDVAFISTGLPCMEQSNDMWTTRMYRVEPKTIGQFTSLYDKNHNEIYEGDILSGVGPDDYLEVRFVRGVFAFLWNGDLDDEFPTCAPTHEWAEVVGNIHDNPDLIKKGK